jgi:3-hydroxybutyryl-CoA dehydrogenase
VLAVAAYLLPRLENSTEIPPVLQEKVDRGELGVKTGKGFYDWTPDSTEALRQRIAHALVEIEKWSRTS